VKVIDRIVPVIFYVPCKTRKTHTNVAPRYLQQQQAQPIICHNQSWKVTGNR